MKSVAVALIATTLAAGAAIAQPPPAAPPPAAGRGAPAGPPPRRIDTALAREAIEAAIASCAAQNIRLSGAVTDAAGNPILVLVPDGSSARTGDIALRKAITVTVTGKASRETNALAAADPALKAKLDAPGSRLITFQGALPIMAGDTLVGAIATSGGTGAQDEACTKVGLDKIQARVK
jgi:uncharacterized protein GlcG (DUF336 family)